jgi:hypothetical protein
MPMFRSKKRQDGSRYAYPILSSGRHSFHGAKPLKQKAGFKVPLPKEQLNMEEPKEIQEEVKAQEETKEESSEVKVGESKLEEKVAETKTVENESETHQAPEPNVKKLSEKDVEK